MRKDLTTGARNHDFNYANSVSLTLRFSEVIPASPPDPKTLLTGLLFNLDNACGFW